MKPTTRRDVLKRAAIAGAATLGAAAAGNAQDAPRKNPSVQHNKEPAVHSKAVAEDHGPKQLFAVVDATGQLRRGMHVASVQHLADGVYEVIFRRDVRRGVYVATLGGHGYQGMPPLGFVGVMGRANNPRAVLVSTTSYAGTNVDLGFHLLVTCPEGYA
jgi:hypothetical protein